MKFLRQCWYMAGWADELGEKPLGRKFLNEPVAMFRDEQGVAHAVSDRCPHRFVPLSLGHCEKSGLVCPYHGLRFDASGACVHNPKGDLPKHASLRAYPLEERHSMLWIWMGDAALADPALIPDFALNDRAHNYSAGRYLHLKGNYQLATDNILDLSHIDFIHANSLAVAFTAASREDVEVKQNGDTVWSNRFFHDVRPTEAASRNAFAAGQSVDELYDRWIDVRWDAPACMLLWSGLIPKGTEKNDANNLLSVHHTHIFTPETETTSHYWFGVAHRHEEGPEFEARATGGAEFLSKPFELEDGPILAAQQIALGDQDFWDAQPILLVGDAAAVRVRRLLDQKIKNEQRAEAAE